MPKLTATGSRFETFMEGWLIAPDAGCTTHGFAYLEILEVTGANSLTVKGDLTTMLAGDERFWIFAPPSVDAQTGTIRGTYTGSTFKPAKCDSRHLWAQYRYMPPMAGYEVNPGTLGIYGRQPGTNQTGTFHAWNRQYDPGTGRWTTPDPAASPWGNLWDYGAACPITRGDPTGLKNYSMSVDDTKCWVNLKMTIQFQFNDGPTLSWSDEKEKEEWALKALQQIYDVWDRKFLLKGKASVQEKDYYLTWCGIYYRWVNKDCPCPNGYTARLELKYTIDGVTVKDDIELVTRKLSDAEAKGKQLANWEGIFGNISVTSQAGEEHVYPNGISQKLIAHEFGHAIGFDDVGKGGKGGLYDDPDTGKPSRNVMGYGNDVTTANAKPWKEYLDSERSECGPYEVTLK